MDELVPIVVGFLLTSVLGGALGTYLQQRAWTHQNLAHLREQEFRRADEISEALSQLLDKRLYRMLRLYFALRRLSIGSGSFALVEERRLDYDAVLYERNDRLNLNLALVGTYFGHAARDWLANQIYKAYQDAGHELEQLYLALKKTDETRMPPAPPQR